MKVKDLIKKLQKLDSEKTIGYYDREFEENLGLIIYDVKNDTVIFDDDSKRHGRKFDYIIL